MSVNASKIRADMRGLRALARSIYSTLSRAQRRALDNGGLESPMLDYRAHARTRETLTVLGLVMGHKLTGAGLLVREHGRKLGGRR